MFIIEIYANITKVLDSRKKTFISHYWSLTKSSRTLEMILLLAYLQSKIQMLFIILQIIHLKNIIRSLLIKKLTPKNQQIFLCIIFKSFIVFSDLSYQIVVSNLLTTFGNSCTKVQTLTYNCLLYGIPKQIIKQND